MYKNINTGTRSKQVRHTLKIIFEPGIGGGRSQTVAEAAYVAVSYVQLRRSSLSSYRWCCKQRANKQVMSHVQRHHEPASRLTAIKAKLHHTVRSAELLTSGLWMHWKLMRHPSHLNQQPVHCAPFHKPLMRLSCHHSITPSLYHSISTSHMLQIGCRDNKKLIKKRHKDMSLTWTWYPES